MGVSATTLFSYGKLHVYPDTRVGVARACSALASIRQHVKRSENVCYAGKFVAKRHQRALASKKITEDDDQ